MFPRLEFRTCDRLPCGVWDASSLACDVRSWKAFEIPRGWFINGVLILLSGSASDAARQRESPRATFPFTINTLLCRAASMWGWRMRRSPRLSRGSVRPPASQLVAFRFVRLWSKPAVRGAPRPSTCRMFSLVKLGSYPAWSLRGSKSRQPTSADFVRRLVVCKASPSPSPSTDPKRNAVRQRSAHATLRSGTRASRRKFVFLSLPRPQLRRLRVCSSAHGNHHPSAAWLGLL